MSGCKLGFERTENARDAFLLRLAGRTGMSIKVLLAEDDSKISNLIRMYLEKEGMQVVTARDGQEALRLFNSDNPDMVILDIMMPFVDGWEVLKKIREKSAVPVIFLTAKDAETDKVTGLEGGADDYVTKPFSPRELVARVKALLRRASGLNTKEKESQIAFPGLVLDTEKRKVYLEGKEIKLTRKEYELLLFLAQSPGRPFNRDMLLTNVWGYDFFGDKRTVDVHIKRIRQKLACGKRTYISTVWGVGYKFEVKENEDQ